MTLTDLTETTVTYFEDLNVGDFFMQKPRGTIWMKINTTFNCIIENSQNKNHINAIQITDTIDYDRYALFTDDTVVEKIEIVSIGFRRTK